MSDEFNYIPKELDSACFIENWGNGLYTLEVFNEAPGGEPYYGLKTVGIIDVIIPELKPSYEVKSSAQTQTFYE